MKRNRGRVMGSAAWRALALGLLAAVPAAGGVAAQQIDSPYRFVDESQALGVFAGWLAAGRGTVEAGPGPAYTAGLRYTIRLSGPFALEGEVGVVPTTRRVFDADTAGGDTVRVQVGEADATVLTLNGALRFNLTGPRTYHGLMPFLLFGGGVAAEVKGDAAAEEGVKPDALFDFGTTFAGQIGAGVEWFGAPRLSFRVDVRDVLWKLETPVVFRTRGVPPEEWTQNFLVAAGVSYRF